MRPLQYEHLVHGAVNLDRHNEVGVANRLRHTSKREKKRKEKKRKKNTRKEKGNARKIKIKQKKTLNKNKPDANWLPDDADKRDRAKLH